MERQRALRGALYKEIIAQIAKNSRTKLKLLAITTRSSWNLWAVSEVVWVEG